LHEVGDTPDDVAVTAVFAAPLIPAEVETCVSLASATDEWHSY